MFRIELENLCEQIANKTVGDASTRNTFVEASVGKIDASRWENWERGATAKVEINAQLNATLVPL